MDSEASESSNYSSMELAPREEATHEDKGGFLKDDQTKKTLVTMCYISLASMLGTLLRIIIAQLFGEECKNPGSVGWLAAAAPLCVTRSGEASVEGGIIFADLPSNLLGSFIMGAFQDGLVLGLAIPMTIAFLSPESSFQQMTILHTAIKTGFCGSLTTFSSWNSEMVVLIFGTGTNRTSQAMKALLGYIIGMESAIGSFSAGKALARRLHRWTNPKLAAEAKAMKRREAEGVYINTQLPEFERRYLPSLEMGGYEELYSIGNTKALDEWKESTELVRRVHHPYLKTLIQIEKAVLIEKSAVPHDAAEISSAEGWALDSLQKWAKSKEEMSDDKVQTSNDEPFFLTLPFAAFLIGAIYVGLLFGLVITKELTAVAITRRTTFYALLVAPAGALLRWKLSVLNGRCTFPKLKWLPLGTFYANLFGSIISIAMVASEYHIESSYPYNVVAFWTIGTMRAIKVGFAGSLTTVSTFVAEISSFMQKSDHAYPYMLLTLGSSSFLSIIIYAFIVYSFN